MNQICSFLRIWSHLLKKSLMENFIFCVLIITFIECAALITQFTVCKIAQGEINVFMEDFSNSVGLERTLKIECNHKECNKNSITITS